TGATVFQQRKREKYLPELPEEFSPGDADSDGQIALFEWAAWKRSEMSAFFEIDSNEDGFLTPRELIAAKEEDDDSDSAFNRDRLAVSTGSSTGRSSRGRSSGSSSRVRTSGSSSAGSSTSRTPSTGRGSSSSRGSSSDRGRSWGDRGSSSSRSWGDRGSSSRSRGDRGSSSDRRSSRGR
ncbi:MAG: hypothetical protein AB8G99_17090, partial [Planctomycetaceae bacterium]